MKNISENPVEAPQYKNIQGLGEALFRGDTDMIRKLLSGVSPGEVIRTWGIELRVDLPTPEEVKLMGKSLAERKEFRLFTAGDTHIEIVGKAGEIDEFEVLRVATQLANLPGPKSFSHTHWDEECTPIPSGPDRGIFRQLSEQWGYKFRVISWLPEWKVFEVVGEYKL